MLHGCLAQLSVFTQCQQECAKCDLKGAVTISFLTHKANRAPLRFLSMAPFISKPAHQSANYPLVTSRPLGKKRLWAVTCTLIGQQYGERRGLTQSIGYKLEFSSSPLQKKKGLKSELMRKRNQNLHVKLMKINNISFDFCLKLLF